MKRLKNTVYVFVITFIILIQFSDSSVYAKPYLYGSKLSSASKYIYDSLVDCYIPASNKKLRLSINNYNLTLSEASAAVNNAVNCFTNDYPYTYYIRNFTWNFTYYSGKTTMEEVYIQPKMKPYFPNIKSYLNYSAAENTALNIMLEKIVEKCKTRYDVLFSINSFLIKNCNYDMKAIDEMYISQDSALTKYGYAWSAYGALIKKKGVCESYAKAFKSACDKLDIPCIYVVGQSNKINHAWNYVKMEDNKWYIVDVTFNDPILIGNISKEVIKKANKSYFLIGNNNSHNKYTPKEAYSAFYPKLSSNDYKNTNKKTETFKLNYSNPVYCVLGKTNQKTNIPSAYLDHYTIKAGKSDNIVLHGSQITDTVIYETSNKKIATINAKGVLKAKKAGTVDILITVARNNKVYSLKYPITVK